MTKIERSPEHVKFSLLALCILLLPDRCFAATPDFELLKLVLQWPKSFCSLQTSNCVRKPLPSKFTIHGLWPDNYSWPLRDCKHTYIQLPTIEDKDLLKDLDRDWPDLTKRRPRRNEIPNKKFWISQWEKHGSCALSVYSFDEYFRETLKLNRRFNILQILEANRLHPGVDVDPEKVARSIAKLTKHAPAVKCPEGILTEIIICFDPSGSGSVIDCPEPLCNDAKVQFKSFVKKNRPLIPLV